MAKEKRTTGGGLWWKILIVVAAVAIIAGAAVYIWCEFIRDTGEYERYQFDTAAIAGRIQRMTEEEIQEELNRVIEEGMFNISIASSIVFPTPDGEGEARIENIAANRYHMQVDIFLDETGERVYSSKLIQPGYSIQYITLDPQLAPGEYDATAIFSAITQDELKLFGQAGAQIKLYVFDYPTPTPTVEPSATPSAEPTAEITPQP